MRDWLAHPRQERWRLHFTPTSASWLNLIEAWFSVLTRKALANNSFNSVADLTETIDIWAQNWNDNPPGQSPGPNPPTTSSPKSNEEEPL